MVELRLNNAGKYCDITLSDMVKLQNVCENCVRILEEENHRQLRMFDILWKKWKKLATGEKPKTVRAPENIAAVAESMREVPSTSIHRRSQQLNISETSFCIKTLV